MEETFVEFLKLNESKNIMAVAGTPLTLAGLWVIFYHKCSDNMHKFDSKVFLYLLSCLASILLLSSIISIIAWAQLSLLGSGLAWAGSKYRCIFISRFLMFLTGLGRIQEQVNFLQNF